MSVIQLPKISKELEEEYLADVQKSYKELLEKLKKSRNDSCGMHKLCSEGI